MGKSRSVLYNLPALKSPRPVQPYAAGVSVRPYCKPSR